MKNVLQIICLFSLVFESAQGQAYVGQIEYAKVPPPAYHYQGEYTFDTTLNAAAWTRQKSGLHAQTNCSSGVKCLHWKKIHTTA